MHAISQEKCVLHQDREAVARCPECQRYFCRECITEHEGRVICSQCLEKILNKNLSSEDGPSWFRAMAQRTKSGLLIGLQVFVALIIIWGSFHYIGQILIDIPSDFHEGTFWELPGDDL